MENWHQTVFIGICPYLLAYMCSYNSLLVLGSNPLIWGRESWFYLLSTCSTVSRSFLRFVSCSLRAEFHIKVWSFLAQIFAFEVNYWPLGGVNDSKSKFYQVKKQGKQTTKAVVPGSNTVSLTVEDRQSHYVICILQSLGAKREISPWG